MAPSGLVLTGFYLLFMALLVLRRPDCLLNSQFWAEDGKNFFADAMQRSFWVNLFSYGFGYFDVLLRMMHEIAALFPLREAPRVLAVFAILIQGAVPVFILSSRCGSWLGPFPVRLVTAFLYCAMPNSYEVHCIPLHSRVHLAVLGALIIISSPATSRLGKTCDIVVLVLSGLSGPFVFALLPAALWRYLRQPLPALKPYLVSLLVTLPFALFALLDSGSRRIAGHLGSSIRSGVRIIGGQLTSSFLLGEKTYGFLLNQSWFDLSAWLGFLVLVLLLFIILRAGSTATQSLLLFGFVLLAMALSAPLAAFDRSHWKALWSVPGCGQRYYLPVMAALLFSVAALAGMARQKWQRCVGAGCLFLIVTMGARVDFVLPPFTDFHFASYVKEYDKLPPEAVFEAPINPPPWTMSFRKPGKSADWQWRLRRRLTRRVCPSAFSMQLSIRDCK